MTASREAPPGRDLDRHSLGDVELVGGDRRRQSVDLVDLELCQVADPAHVDAGEGQVGRQGQRCRPQNGTVTAHTDQRLDAVGNDRLLDSDGVDPLRCEAANNDVGDLFGMILLTVDDHSDRFHGVSRASAIAAWAVVGSVGAEPGQELPIALGPANRGCDNSGHGQIDLLEGRLDPFDRASVEPGVGDDPALPDLVAADFELRFDQHDPVGAPGPQGRQGTGDDPERDEREIRDDQVEWRSKRGRIGMANVGAFNDRDPGVGAEAPVELAVSDVDGRHGNGPALKEAVGEPTGGRSHVDRRPPDDADAEPVDPGLELASASPHEPAHRFVKVDGVGGAHQRARPRFSDAPNPNEALGDRALSCGAAVGQLAPHELGVQSTAAQSPGSATGRASPPAASSSSLRRSAICSATGGASAGSAASS